MFRYALPVMMVVALVGCQDTNREVAQEREDLSQARQEASQQVGEARQDASEQVAETQRSAQEKVTEERQQLTAAQREEQEKTAQDSGTTLSLTGTVASADANEISVREASGEEFDLKLADDAQVMRNNQPISKEQLSEGQEIRATYRMDGSDRVAERIEVTQQANPSQQQQQQRQMEQQQRQMEQQQQPQQ